MPSPLTPYLLWIKLGLAAVALAALVALGWRINGWKRDAEALPGAQEALAAEVACQAPSKCAERVAALQAAQAAVSQQVVQSYEQEIAVLRDRPVRTRTVRLCPEAAAGDVRDADPAGSPDGAGPGTGIIHGQAGPTPDIGPSLYALAAEADEIAARLRALQSWNKALSAPPVE